MRAHQITPLILAANSHHHALIYSYMTLNPPNCRLVNTLSLQNSFIKTYLKASPLRACDTDALTPHSAGMVENTNRSSPMLEKRKQMERENKAKKSRGDKAEVCGNRNAAGCFSPMNYGGWIALNKRTQVVRSFLFCTPWFMA